MISPPLPLPLLHLYMTLSLPVLAPAFTLRLLRRLRLGFFVETLGKVGVGRGDEAGNAAGVVETVGLRRREKGEGG